jgi:dUTPase
MNVDDIKGDVIPTSFSPLDRLDLIFQRQHALMEKYVPIEVANNLCHTPDCPVGLHDRYGQARLKDFFWRITEELTEAVEANRIHPELKNHVFEELADSLHFLVECCLLADVYAIEFDMTNGLGDSKCKLEGLCTADNGLDIEVGSFEIIYYLGCASNCLKNRPWKQNHQYTDIPKFRDYIKKCLPLLIDVLVSQGLSADEIFRMYWKKSEVNKFRQRSGY